MNHSTGTFIQPSAVGAASDLAGEEFEYRSLSRAAIGSIIFFVLGLFGLMFAALLALAGIGVGLAAYALRAIARYPEELSGRTVAWTGLVLNGLLLVGGIGLHAWIYLHEVPPGYLRVAFAALQRRSYEPDVPTDQAAELSGQQIFLKGYMHPSSGSGQLRKFILVPDLGTCCFGGQPKSTDMIEVTLENGQTVNHSLRRMKLAGKFEVDQRAVAGFDNVVYYRLKAQFCD
jgi:hypothetical protein